MNRILVSFILSLFFISTFAQLQKGKVRTPGRNGKPGVGIENVLIRVKGSHNDESSDKNGVFSLQLGGVRMGNGFQIASIRKAGYEIFDKNLRLPSTFPYSNVPIDIVMIKSEDLAHEKQAWIEKGYNNAEKLYSKRLAELKSKYKDEQERNAKLKDLEEWYEKYQGLIEGMADYYVHVDYDRLDEGLRQITNAIQDGEYLMADSLINVYAPNLEEDVEKSIKARENIRERKEYGENIIAKAISDSIELTKRNEKTASFLYAKYTTSVNANKWDDALHYLKLRADLDTTNVSAVWLYAQFAYSQNKYDESLRYYQKCEGIYNANDDTVHLAKVLTNIAAVYKGKKNYEKAEYYNEQAIGKYLLLNEPHPNLYVVDFAVVMNNMGELYIDKKEYAQAELHLSQALQMREYLYNIESDRFGSDYAVSLSNIAGLYFDEGEYAKAENYIKKAIDILQPLYEKYPKYFGYSYFGQKNKLALVYLYQEKVDSSEIYFKDAVQGLKLLMELNQNSFKPVYSKALHDLGGCYLKKEDFKQSERFYKEALKFREELYAGDSIVYGADIANTLYMLGTVYDRISDYEQAERHLLRAQNIIEILYDKNPDIYEVALTDVYILLYQHYGIQNKIDKSDDYYFMATQMFDSLLGRYGITEQVKDLYKKQEMNLKYIRACQLSAIQDREEALKLAEECYEYDKHNASVIQIYVQCLNNCSYDSAYSRDFAKAISIIDKAIQLMPNEANLFDSKGEILLMQGKNEDALKMWKKVLELNPNFLDNYSEGTNLSNGLKKLGLVE